MNKKSRKDPLDNEQRSALDQLHKTQITLEVALAIFIFTFFTINASSAYPGYGITALLAIGISGLLIFFCGIIITSAMFRMKRLANPVAKYSSHARRWLIVAWACVPMIIFFFLLTASSKNAEDVVLYLVLAGLAALLMLAAIVCVLVGLHVTWRRFNKKKRSPVRLIVYGIIGLIMLALMLFGSYTTNEAVKYNSTSITDSNLELGQSEVRQAGKDGEKEVRHNLIFGIPLSTETKEPIDEIVANGSRKYQYMYCSNGTYRYFTAEQFKDPNVGFTHQSPDACAQNGAGTQTTIADVPPAEKIIQQVPTYRSPTYTTCTESYFSGSFTCRSY